MLKRFSVLLFSLLVASCQTPDPVTIVPSLSAHPALAVRNPADIAVLPIEDATLDRGFGKLRESMRQALMTKLTERLYSPLSDRVVDAALSSELPMGGETVLTPSYLKRVAGRSTEDALLAVRIDRWDETPLLTDKKVRFQLQVAMVASDGEVLWSGGFGGEVKAGGLSAAPRDRELMARSCAELVASELLQNLPQRKP
ncbi:MAG: hypothetical protein RL148_3096 [Planctomycetota bacterium]|jgi:hypothetical protein